jgi:mannosyltransferase
MSAPSRARTSERLAPALIALTVLAAAVRFSTLGVQSYWLDEAVTVNLLHGSLGGMLSAIPDSESTPPLYYVLAWLWSKLFGTGEVGLRSLSALFGTATVPLAYLAGCRLVSRRAGLVVAALAAVNPLLVWFSQEARAYALLLLLTTAALAVFARLLERPTARALAGWAVLCALALAAHYFAVFVVAPQVAWVLLRLRARALPAVAIVAGAGAALLPLALHQAHNHRADFIREITLAARILQVPKQYLVGYDAPLEVAATIAAAALAAYGLWLLAARATDRERGGAAVAAGIAAPALLLPLALAVGGADYVVTRNLIAAWVPFTIVFAAGLGARRAGRAGAIATAALCALSLATVVTVEANPAYQRGDWRGAAHALGPVPRGGRALVIAPVYGVIPLGIYTPRVTVLPPGPVGVSEIDVLSVTGNRSGASGARRGRPAMPPPGFAAPRVVESQTYTLVRYRATAGHAAVTVPVLLGLTRSASDVAFQAPPGWRPPPL